MNQLDKEMVILALEMAIQQCVLEASQMRKRLPFATNMSQAVEHMELQLKRAELFRQVLAGWEINMSGGIE